MDSLTQIVLGAAVGEVCLGKRLGNRAMLWGGIAGTIPDLDVISNLWLTPLQGLVVHRGISHSLFFAVLFSFLIAWLVKRYYDSNLYTHKGIRKLASGLASVGVLAFFGGMASLFYYFEIGSIGLAITTSALLGFGIYVVYRTWKYYGLVEVPMDIKIDYKSWYLFFFMTIFTHPILDCFTVYGTQIWAPFSDQRIAWNNIAVADPAYTLPFGLLLIATSLYQRGSRMRARMKLWMLVFSCGYMALTFVNKYYIDTLVEKTMAAQGIKANRYMTNPTILNNILWSATVEADSVYYQGSYSHFDKEAKFKFVSIPKNHQLLGAALNGDKTVRILRWFSNDYFCVLKRQDGRLQINDMRYGAFNASNANPKEDDFIFKFILEKDKDGKFGLAGEAGRPPKGQEREMMAILFKRIMGI
ncbi:MAG: metal-dependent hydrolase [Saprospiraceae bacterium]|nr:metal-dependent hydrolase [Saprospiraceae bacterium]